MSEGRFYEVDEIEGHSDSPRPIALSSPASSVRSLKVAFEKEVSRVKKEIYHFLTSQKCKETKEKRWQEWSAEEPESSFNAFLDIASIGTKSEPDKQARALLAEAGIDTVEPLMMDMVDYKFLVEKVKLGVGPALKVIYAKSQWEQYKRIKRYRVREGKC